VGGEGERVQSYQEKKTVEIKKKVKANLLTPSGGRDREKKNTSKAEDGESCTTKEPNIENARKGLKSH